MGALGNELTHDVLSVWEALHTYLQQSHNQDKLQGGLDGMDINSFEAIPNQLQDSIASIAK